MVNFDVLDIHGNPTGLSQRVVYYIRNTAHGRYLWSEHGRNSEGTDNVRAHKTMSEEDDGWHIRNECAWSIHEAHGSSNPVKYRIVTKGKILHASHGMSNISSDSNGNYNSVNALGKCGGSEWHKIADESQWQFEKMDDGSFRIGTSHKVLWLSRAASNQDYQDVRGLNRSGSFTAQYGNKECRWKFEPKKVEYHSRIYDLDYGTPEILPVAAEQVYESNFRNGRETANSDGVTITTTMTCGQDKTSQSKTTLQFSESDALTLSRSTSFSMDLELPYGVKFGGSTTSSEGMEHKVALMHNQETSVTATQKLQWSVTATYGVNTYGRVLATFSKGHYIQPFTSKCDVRAKVLIAPENYLEYNEEPKFEFGYGGMVKNVLTSTNFDGLGDDVNWNDGKDLATFTVTGTLDGKCGMQLNTDVIYEEPPVIPCDISNEVTGFRQVEAAKKE